MRKLWEKIEIFSILLFAAHALSSEMVISFVMWSPRSGRNQSDWCLTLQEGCCCLSLGVRALPVSFLLKCAIKIDTYLASQGKNICTIKCPEGNKKVYFIFFYEVS